MEYYIGIDLVVDSPRFYSIIFLSMVLFSYLSDQNGEENLDGQTHLLPS